MLPYDRWIANRRAKRALVPRPLSCIHHYYTIKTHHYNKSHHYNKAFYYDTVKTHHCYIVKTDHDYKLKNVSCEIEDFVETLQAAWDTSIAFTTGFV